MSLQQLSARVVNELVIDKIDRDWVSHQLPKDDIPIPAHHIPDQDVEVNFLAESENRWQDTRPFGLCLDHSHNHR
uniref:Uncharacterized protein n=1 Tax=Acrobeloides nanus TaxID=290746 RepID=A0A914DIE7_9BILA